MKDEIRLVIPAEEDFRPIAHLVTGGLASRLDLTYDHLEDLQVAVEALLGLRDDQDDLVLALGVEERELHAEIGPFPASAVGELEEDRGELGLRRVLETVCDSFEIEQREDGSWVELSKTIATAGAAG